MKPFHEAKKYEVPVFPAATEKINHADKPLNLEIRPITRMSALCIATFPLPLEPQVPREEHQRASKAARREQSVARATPAHAGASRTKAHAPGKERSETGGR
jgi:hypothetical protein